MLRICAIGLFFCITSVGHAWNALGHQLVAQIAYNHLSLAEKKRYQAINQALPGRYAAHSFVKAAAWLDTVKKPASLKSMHYIDLPFSQDHTPLQKHSSLNAVTAVEKAIEVLRENKQSKKEQAFQFRVLLHVIADLHQPMHAINSFSRFTPKGDKGGNAYPLGFNRIGVNLHQYWDRGGGFLRVKKGDSLYKIALRIEKREGCPRDSHLLTPKVWAQESFLLAQRVAYTLPRHHKPSRAYQKKVQQISQKRIALAGCRLARLLSQKAMQISLGMIPSN